MKTALLVVSFGTTHPDTLEKTIAATENALACAFPEYPVFRAFTSGVVRKRLLDKYGIQTDSVAEAMKRIAGAGFDRVIVQPTLLIPGEEYDRLSAQVRAAAGTLRLSMGKPLLWEERDLDDMLQVLKAAYPVAADTVLLLMGHGTAHSANRIYLRLAEKMRETPGAVMRLCTVEGTPSFDDILAELRDMSQRKVCLAPMLLVAGDHAKNDMAGTAPGSLRARLESQGFTVECILRGLGELEAVRRMYIRRVETALEQ